MNTHNKTIFGASVMATALLVASSSAWAGEIKGKVTAQGLRSPENIAVYVDAISGKAFPAPAQPALMNQLHLAFSPHVLVVMKGTTVAFKNGDSVGHNVYWPSVNHNRSQAHNMGTWPQGISKPFTFNELGDVPLLCNVHPEMSAYVLVVPTPYFALTDKQGNFEIKDIPPGQYTLKIWSEEAKPLTQAVTVTAAGADVNLIVKK